MRRSLRDLFAKQVRVLLVLTLLLSGFTQALRVPIAHATADTVYSDATQIDLTGDDNSSTEQDLPFPITYYDQTFSHYIVSTNGYISFVNDSHQQAGYQVNPFNKDLYSYDVKNILVKTIGDAPNRKFIVQWSNTGLCCSSGVPVMTFQSIFSETSNTIQFQYLYNLGGADGDGTSANIGINTPVGTSIDYNPDRNPVVTPRKSILFTPTDNAHYSVSDEVEYLPIYLRTANQPEVPTIVSPADGAANVSTVSWNATPNASSYKVFLSKTPQFTEDSTIELHSTPNTSLALMDTPIVSDNNEGVAPETTYYWFVQALGDGGSEPSAIHTLTTAPAAGHNIANCAELQAMDQVGSKFDTYNLTNDIDCTGVDFVPLYQNSDFPLQGRFNGHGHTISNLTINSGGDYNGLFAETNTGATVENVTLAGGSVNGYDQTGALIGFARGTTIANVHSNLTVTATGNQVGGLVGMTYADRDETSRVRDSSASGNVTGGQSVGGLVGYVNSYEGDALIQRSFATGNVQQADSNQSQFGGLVGLLTAYTEDDGHNGNAAVEDSYAHGNVVAGQQVGGLVGGTEANNDNQNAQATVAVRQSYASGTVSGTNLVGGLLGYTYVSTSEGNQTVLSDNFAATPISVDDGATWYAGFLGSGGGTSPEFTNNYYGSDLTVANANCSSIGTPTGCTAEEDVARFKDNHTNAPFTVEGNMVWDFDDVWRTKADDYPTLRGYSPEDSLVIDSAETGAPIVIEQSGCNALSNPTAAKESGLSLQDPAYSYPVGLTGFYVTGCPAGGDATVTVTFVGSFDTANIAVRKFNASTNSFAMVPGATKTVTTYNDQLALRVVYMVTDGGPLDQDGVANGTIVDPVGLATQVVGVPNTGLGSQS